MQVRLSVIVVMMISLAIALNSTAQTNPAEFPDYHIIYLISDDAITQDFDTTEYITRSLGDVAILTQWEEVLFFEQLLGIDGLVLHSSMVDEVDSEWLQEAIRFGLVVTFIDIDLETVNTLLDRDINYDYTLIEDDVVFFTLYRFNRADMLEGTTLGDAEIRSSAGGRVNQLSTEEGQFVFTLMLEDIAIVQALKYGFMADILD